MSQARLNFAAKKGAAGNTRAQHAAKDAALTTPVASDSHNSDSSGIATGLDGTVTRGRRKTTITPAGSRSNSKNRADAHARDAVAPSSTASAVVPEPASAASSASACSSASAAAPLAALPAAVAVTAVSPAAPAASPKRKASLSPAPRADSSSSPSSPVSSSRQMRDDRYHTPTKKPRGTKTNATSAAAASAAASSAADPLDSAPTAAITVVLTEEELPALEPAVAAASPASVSCALPSESAPAAGVMAFSSATVSPAAAAAAAASSVPSPLLFQLHPSTFRSSAQLQAALSGLASGVLPFPTALTSLLSIFHAVDTTLMMERDRGSTNYPASWKLLLPSVQRIYSRRTVELSSLQQILTLMPTAYTLGERHVTDRDSKLAKDYAIEFGSAVSAAGTTDLRSRRASFENAILQWIDSAHRKFLQRLLAKAKHDGMLESAVSHGDAAAAAAAMDTADDEPTEIHAIEAFLATPLASLRMWYPGFNLESPLDCPLPAPAPLPDAQLKAMLAKAAHHHADAGLVALATRKQAIPVRNSLASEQSGRANSTSHGAKLETTSAAAAAAGSSSSSSSAAASLPSSSALSVLDSAVVSRFRSEDAARRAATAACGDPAARDHLRALSELTPLYSAIQFALKSGDKRNMPLKDLESLLQKQSQWSVAADLRSAVRLLASILPAWCVIDKSPHSGLEIFKLKPGGKAGADHNIDTINAAIAAQQDKIQAAGAETSHSTAAAASLDASVKAEPAAAAAAASSSAAAAAIPVVKAEPLPSPTAKLLADLPKPAPLAHYMAKQMLKKSATPKKR